ncbi:hypothetical protein CPTAKMNP4_132 [Salmonella phage vB_SenM-AKM_NP4]|nr:hypothetical protein STP4a_126 [Salmonella phage STP4-a]YP_009148121.1 hypothetical protein ACQ31_gp196 [Salmonella phage STML-198]YP_009615616.1 hypothetical protein FDI73_gp260 [Salmonella phage Melville]UPW42501.1 hypothetical protein EBPHNEJP_00214 [Salmonella phage CF-SP2]WDR21793.1 hypothetical protein PJM34_0125 [Salmonella phage vB_SenM_UTK0003]WLI71754.1 hypothetical protein CPTAKMNP4_132 [Salmonella phage vB_SenM-AKM_NP4]AFU64079.1 hypothetical protein [Salmonella phage STML-198]
MKKLKEIQKYFRKNYNFDKKEFTEWDFAFAGIIAGLVLTSINSVFLWLAVIVYMTHQMFKR